MANKKISELPSGSTPTGAELLEGVQGGVNKQFTRSQIKGYRGDWDPTGDVLPSSAAIGDIWRLTADYKGWRGLIQAAVLNPASDADWNFINLTTF